MKRRNQKRLVLNREVLGQLAGGAVHRTSQRCHDTDDETFCISFCHTDCVTGCQTCEETYSFYTGCSECC